MKEYPCSVRIFVQPLQEHGQPNEGWRAERNPREWSLCATHHYQNQSRSPSSSHEVLATLFLLAIEIRPQGEGKGIQASILVPITRLKPRALTSPRERRNRPLLTAWCIRLTHSNIHNSIQPFLSKNSENFGVGRRAHKHESLILKGYRSTQTFHATRAYVRVALFRPDINAHSMPVNAHTHLHYPSQKQWFPGMRGKQEPPRRARSGAPTCSHESLVGMFSHAHQSTGRETASPDPTRVLTQGESDVVKWHDNTWKDETDHSSRRGVSV